MVIVLDAGHGGGDRSNIGYSGKYYEHIGNLEYTLKLEKHLKNKGFKVILTRDKDIGISLSDRSRIAINNKADIFISIHSDAASSSSAGGTSIFYSINRQNDKTIAERLGKCVAASYGVNFRGAYTKASTTRIGFDYYTVIDVAANYKKLMGNNSLYEVPHVFLLERCFHSNPNEEKLLLDESISEKSAKALSEELYNIFLKGQSKEDEILIMNSLVCQKVVSVNTSLNVRELPNTNSQIIGSLKNGDIVTVTGVTNDGWLRIAFNGKDAFISGTYTKDYKAENKEYNELLQRYNDSQKEIAELQNGIQKLNNKINSAINVLNG